MSISDFSRGLPRRSSAAWISAIGAALGIGLYTFILFWGRQNLTPPSFGMEIYDQLYLALMDGRLDVPARAVRFEGHYWPDGTAYLYHGMAPVLTRFLLAPFVDIGAASLAPTSLWLWATSGTLMWHLAFLCVGNHAWPEDSRGATVWSALLAFAVWLGTPGMLLVANFSFYHEPIAVAYALCAGFVLLWTRALTTGQPMTWALVGLAFFAALCVHARPNVAVGLYAGTIVAVGLSLYRSRRSAFVPAILALAVLGAGGGGYLALNKAKFGNAAEVHGSFEGDGVQYGSVFWGVEVENSKRSQAFIEHGRFNLGRVPANAVMYFAAPPQKLLPKPYERFYDWHEATTAPSFGTIRVEPPGGGIVFLWTGFAVLAAIGLVFGRRLLLHFAGPLIATGSAALLTLSYGTITLRYHVDIWPFIGALALVGCAVVVPVVANSARPNSHVRIAFLTIAVGVLSNSVTARTYAHHFREEPGKFFQPMTGQMCQAQIKAKGFDSDRTNEICRPLRGGSDQN